MTADHNLTTEQWWKWPYEVQHVIAQIRGCMVGESRRKIDALYKDFKSPYGTISDIRRFMQQNPPREGYTPETVARAYLQQGMR